MEKGKGTEREMEYLLKLLHKEWERSGRTKKRVPMDAARLKETWAMLSAAVKDRQAQLEMGEKDLKQCMKLSRENFILLRLVRKIKKAGDKAERPDNGGFLMVEMDREEYRLFSALVKAQGE